MLTSHRKFRLLCSFTTGYASIVQDQAFHALNVQRNDSCGLGTTTAGIVTDGRTACFETFTPFKCLTAAERLITVLCLKSSVDIRLRSQETSSPHAVPCTHYQCCLPSGLTVSGRPTTCPPPISNRTHLPLTTACSTATLASLFIPVKLKVPV